MQQHQYDKCTAQCHGVSGYLKHLCAEVLVAASVPVNVLRPLRIDVLVSGDNNGLCLDLRLLGRILELGRRGDCRKVDLVIICRAGRSLCGCRRFGLRSFGLRSFRLGSFGLGSWVRGLLVVIGWGVRTAKVKLHVGGEVASLGAGVIWQDVGHRSAGDGVVTGEDRAPRSIKRELLSTCVLVAHLQVVSLRLGWAVASEAVDIGHVEVVHLVFGLLVHVVHEVFELGDVVRLALLGLGDLDRDTSSIKSRTGVDVVLSIHLALLEGHHLVGVAAIALEDRPDMNVVVAAVDDACVGLSFVALLVEGDGVSVCDGFNRTVSGNGCDHRGRDGEEGELHG
jgi:hypothetical protein